MGIRSERRLGDEVHLNLAYRWFCSLGLDAAVPDQSTFSKNRHGRFRDSDVLRQLFEATVAACMAVDLVGGEAFAVDVSMIRADANRKNVNNNGDRQPTAATPAVRDYLATLDDAAFGAATPVVPKVLVTSSDKMGEQGLACGNAPSLHAICAMGVATVSCSMKS